MRVRKSIYTFILGMAALVGFGSGISAQESQIRREVKLYNPYKPTLSRESKLGFLPDMNDTSTVNPQFRYDVTPRVFMPEYQIRTISAARIQPDPLTELYKGYLNVGFGNYFTPMGELSISSERSRNRVLGLYLHHMSSYGKVQLENDLDAYAGYMDNEALLYGTRLFRRSALKSTISFDHARRYAYGYDPGMIVAPETDRDSLRVDYINPAASINFYSTRADSSTLDWDVKLDYNFLFQEQGFYQHKAGIGIAASRDIKIFYLSALAGYSIYMYGDSIDDKPRHVVYLNPSINKMSDSWSFKIGLKLLTDTRNEFDEVLPPDYKTTLFLFPDVKFQFKIIPSFMSFFVSLDGYEVDNDPVELIRKNPYLLREDPSGLIRADRQLYTARVTNNKLRVMGGFLGSAGDHSTYKLLASYTLFEDMMFFTSDLAHGRCFIPVYDNGELLNIRGEADAELSEKISMSASGNFYNYKLESIEHPWYKPSWDGSLKLTYNLRNKILADAGFNAVGKRYGQYGPMPYSILTEPTVVEMPLFVSLSLGLEYRYTKILSFWTRLDNISYNRYSDWNFYPTQRFLFTAGFSYSL